VVPPAGENVVLCHLPCHTILPEADGESLTAVEHHDSRDAERGIRVGKDYIISVTRLKEVHPEG